MYAFICSKNKDTHVIVISFLSNLKQNVWVIKKICVKYIAYKLRNKRSCSMTCMIVQNAFRIIIVLKSCHTCIKLLQTPSFNILFNDKQKMYETYWAKRHYFNFLFNSITKYLVSIEKNESWCIFMCKKIGYYH